MGEKKAATELPQKSVLGLIFLLNSQMLSHLSKVSLLIMYS